MSKKYKEDYTLEEKEILYTGEYYSSVINAENRKKFVIQYIIYFAVVWILFIAAGILNNDGSRNFLIAVPFVFLLLPMLYFGMGIYNLSLVEEKMEYARMDKSFGRLVRCSVAMQILSIYLCIGDLLYLLLCFREIQVIREITFFLIMAVFCITNTYIGRKTKNIRETVTKQAL